MKNIIRTWMRRKNNEGKMLRTKKFITRWFNGEINAVSVFYMIINPLRFLFYTIIKKYRSLILLECVKNGVYKIFLSNENPVKVIKIPKKDNIFSLRFTNRIRNQKDFNLFREKLQELSKLDFINRHIVDVHEVFRNGGYSSSYINGLNLAVLMNHECEKPCDVVDIVYAIDELLESIRKHVELHGKFCGDWMPQNLIYDIDNKRIINVDLEGFFLYTDEQREAQFDVIHRELENIRKILLAEC